ncbi:YpmS family protein [Robertmurraya massiliosenegalensis]|uniref:YpmS family protein n=1 Tax=Robertmurraya massiliosenegalensis TaxID=1287657 RepID=UPI0002E5CF56|nr:YpmS family protein [Robertmurraya massiliosenegalensis]
MGVQFNKKPSWKHLFLGLAGANGILLILFFVLLLWPVSDSEMPEKAFIEEEPGAEFTVNSSKQNLNELVNEYVDKFMNDQGDKYTVDFGGENVRLLGSIDAFQTEIPISITLEPLVQENGDLVLYTSEMSLGLLQLPEKKILEYVKKELETPDWVNIDPSSQSIYIGVTEMEVKSNFKVKVQSFDLKNDQITFRIKVPNKTLGL